jgi:asparagine synthase (glutamine-hydrolysing)
MCGIVGIKCSDGLAEVERMLAGIQHRGPDARRFSKAGDWSLGHARLSILDVAGGSQPMIDEKSGAQIVYNGEIYNFKELRSELGGKYRTESDTEVILRYHESGLKPEEWLPKLDGMYAFAIVDDDGLLLARDPLGIKPLYMGLKGNQVVFASEMKSVLAVTDRIMEFPPGHVYTSKGGGRAFRELHMEEAGLNGAEAISQELLSRLTDAVHSRLISDVPLGVFLSGGLDSSLIAALACQFSPHIKTFAVGIEGSPDLVAARSVAKHLGTDHYERIFTFEEAIQILPTVLYHLESFDAALVRSAVPNYFLSELAAKHVKVALSGEGADELFAGYKYLAAMEGEQLSKELIDITEALHFTNLQRCDRMSMAHGLEVRVPFLDDLRIVEFAMGIPVEYKRGPSGDVEKWILRKAVAGLLPDDIVWRKKLKFAYGAGLGNRLADWASTQIDDKRFARAQAQYRAFGIRNKEEMAYFLLFRNRFPAEKILSLIGRSRSL